jgi:uncharacterized NAD(P)/FAD-binding protein YdhS
LLSAGRPVAVVVGGGASGTLAATALLERTRADVIVVEPRRRLGRGVAYSTPDPLHRLNVPAGSMSAYPDDPGHLLRWLAQRGAGHDGAFSFPRRSEYGVYLAETLRDAADRSSARLAHLRDTVAGLDRRAGAWRARLASGRDLAADLVVLAVGGTRAPGTAGWADALRADPRYVDDPWAEDAITQLPDAPVLCVGTGLTAVDVALSATEWSRCASVVAVSRHGLRPVAHRVDGAPAWSPRLAAGRPATALGLLRAARAEVALATARGLDWRDVINGLRPSVPALWAALPDHERERFASRLGRYWDVHRHRLAPDIAQRVGGLERSGRLRFEAATVARVEHADRALRVVLRHPDASTSRVVVAAVVNCTGRSVDVADHPLLANLHAAGLCRRGSAGLGIACDPTGRVLGASGDVTGLMALGPLRRGDVWESTAVPEIREQAFTLAAAVRGRRSNLARMAG